ncbi:PepSY-associated TM helix domain-containing protein [Silvimonas soli]|uniref:PepSY-associated TM helix domain-containing protein n=1 Tax=Silvimonas soli TaxID=2980100 RepID=UPI0024B31FC5|nr:PepSY-associated TM helix domain-containing protein [Silvimonas soli]
MRLPEMPSPSSATLRLFQSLHTWTGLLAGFALFVAFYAGAITVFQDDIAIWQNPANRSHHVETPAEGQLLIDRVIAAHPDAKARLSLQLPTETGSRYVAWWFDTAKKDWQSATLAHMDGTAKPESDLTSFINAVHYSLGIPVGGIYFMGVVSVLYCLALVSGLLIHLPRLSKDLLALRAGKNLKRLWQDAHNLIGVFSLPFHIIFATTAAVFCLYGLLLTGFDTLAYGGKLMGKINGALDVTTETPAANKSAVMLPLPELLERARQQAPDFEASALTLLNYGDANAEAAVRGNSERSLAPYGNIGVHLADGHILDTQIAGERDINHATMSGAYSLHFGSFGHYAVKWLYFVLGLMGAFLFYSGNLLWVESRRKSRQEQQGRAPYHMAQATIGVCIGTCVAISGAFVAAQLGAALNLDVPLLEREVCYGLFFCALLFAFTRPPIVAAVHLLRAAALMTFCIPLANGLLTGDYLLITPWRGDWQIFGVDAIALLMGGGFLWLARLTRRRQQAGQANSVWAMTSAPPRRVPAINTA